MRIRCARLSDSRGQPLIIDHNGVRGYIRAPSGAVLAIDLVDGEVLWRIKTGSWPLLAWSAKLIAARVPAPHAIAMVVLEASSGREGSISQPLLLPEWIEVSLTDESVFSLRARGEGGIVEVHWRAHARYRGGAAPSARVLENSARDAEGAFQFDVETGEIEVIPAAAGRGARLAEAPAASSAASTEPDVIEQHDIGNRRFQLVARTAEKTELLVRALDLENWQTLWETAVEEASSRGPRPLRP